MEVVVSNNGRKFICIIAAIVCFAVILSATDCYAYLDPSAGGWLYQLIFPVIIAISGAWVALQRHLLALWRSYFSNTHVGGFVDRFIKVLSDDNVKALFMLPVVCSGVVLPVEFLAEVNNYLGFMHFWEMFPVFGWQWLFFVIAGFLISFIIQLSFAAASRIFCLSIPRLSPRFLLWLSLSLCLFSLQKGAKLWFESSGILIPAILQPNWPIVTFTAIISVIWIKKSLHTANYLLRFATFTAFAGFIVTAIAPAITWIKSPSEVRLLPIDSPAGNKKRPNIILVTVDSLAASHCSIYGYERETTPNLKNLAKEADLYERFYANSNFTNSSVNSILHGVLPWTHRSLQLPGMPLASVARVGMVTRLKEAGYQTFAVATNRYASPYINASEPYFDQVANGEINRFSERIGIAVTKFYHLYPLFRMLTIDATANSAVDRILVILGVYNETNHFDPERAFLPLRQMIMNRKTDRPFFSWVHLYPPHSPYATPAPFRRKFDQSDRHLTRFNSSPPWCYEAAADKSFPDEYSGRYDESVAYVDSHIGRFIEWLKTQNIYDDAVIVFSSDHGESFSHGYGAHSGPALHEDLIHVPLIIKGPHQSKGRSIPFLSEQIDLMPTLLEYAGLTSSNGGEGISMTSASHLDKINRQIFSMNFEQNYCFGQLYTGTVAMIQGEWKYVIYFGDIRYPGMPLLENSLYNLRLDPGENSNLITSKPEIAAEMLAAIATQLREHGGMVKE